MYIHREPFSLTHQTHFLVFFFFFDFLLRFFDFFLFSSESDVLDTASDVLRLDFFCFLCLRFFFRLRSSSSELDEFEFDEDVDDALLLRDRFLFSLYKKPIKFKNRVQKLDELSMFAYAALNVEYTHLLAFV